MLYRYSLGVLLLLLLFLGRHGVADEHDVRWYKGNLHTHSLWSDGNDYPEMICDWYASHGYHFLALSDHNILSQGEKWVPESQAARRGAIDALRRYRARFGEEWVETRERDGQQEVRLKALSEFRSLVEKPGEFLLIQGEEITDHFGSLPIHINATNLVELIRPQGGESVRDTIARNLRAINEQRLRVGRPILAHLNHPNYGYAVTAEDMAAVSEERFFEIYNGHPAVAHLGDEQHVGLERMWDIANTIRLAELQSPPLYGLATDDSHNYFGMRDSSPGRGWVMVRADRLEPAAIVNAIERGDFYASSGVSLNDIQFDAASGRLTIQIEAEPGVEYSTRFIGTREGFDKSSHPVEDDQGQELSVTRVYSPDVGETLQTVSGATPTYQMTSDELYVRAVITSTKPHSNPSYEDQSEQAWVQPVVRGQR